MDNSLQTILNKARQLSDACDMNVELMKFETKRVRRKKNIPEEEVGDTPIDNPDQKFRVEVATVDVMTKELQKRKHREVTFMFGFL